MRSALSCAAMTDLHHRKLEAMYLGAPVNRLYEPTIAISDGAATIEMDVKPELFHAAGALHGSAVFKMLDDACFFAASSRVEDVFVLTVSFTTYFVRPASSGRLVCRGRVVHAGKSLLLAEAVVVGAGDKEVGRGNGSFMRSGVALSPDIGYGTGT
jgi:uncharacterized protein (TIGR00369 family)